MLVLMFCFDSCARACDTASEDGDVSCIVPVFDFCGVDEAFWFGLHGGVCGFVLEEREGEGDVHESVGEVWSHVIGVVGDMGARGV